MNAAVPVNARCNTCKYVTSFLSLGEKKKAMSDRPNGHLSIFPGKEIRRARARLWRNINNFCRLVECDMKKKKYREKERGGGSRARFCVTSDISFQFARMRAINK